MHVPEPLKADFGGLTGARIVRFILPDGIFEIVCDFLIWMSAEVFVFPFGLFI